MRKNKIIHAETESFTIYYEGKNDPITIRYIDRISYRNYSNTFKYRRKHDDMILTPVQRGLFKQLIYGLNHFKQDQLQKISNRERIKILTRHNKAMEVIRILKLRAICKDENKLLSAIFQQDIGSKKEDYEEFEDEEGEKVNILPGRVNLRKLGITTRQMVNAFIENSLLPENFAELSVPHLNLI